MNPHRISIWVLRGGNAGLSYNFCLKRLLFRGTAVLCLGVLAIYGVRQLGPTKAEKDEQALALLREYMAKRMQAAAIPNPAESVKLEYDKPEIDEQLDRKIKLLVDEFVRVHNYEKQLRARSEALESVLESAVDMEASQFVLPEGESSAQVDEDKGIGGGEVSNSPLFQQYPGMQKKGEASAKKVSKNSVTRSIVEQVELQIDSLNRIPLGSPVLGRASSGYGMRRSPFSRRRQMHQGYDVSVTRKSVVRATADGVVIKAGRKGAYGRTIIVDHGGRLETLYGHLSKITVSVGDRVCRGQAIGLVGSTGRSTGPHVHYEVIVAGVPKDPEPYIELASLLKSVQ